MNRFKTWAMSLSLCILSAVSLLVEDRVYGTGSRENDKDEPLILDSDQILYFYIVVSVVSVLGFFISMCKEGGKLKIWIETILIILNLILWIVISLAILFSRSMTGVYFKSLTLDLTDSQGEVEEPNVYFFSFGSLFNAVYLFSSWFKQYILRDVNALTATQWSFLATSGFLVMLSGISVYDPSSCGENDSYSCARIWMSMIFGLTSGIVGALLVPLRRAPLKCQAELALLLIVTWATAIGILTFGTGPAVFVNTMYMGIFISFFLSINIMTTVLYADAILDESPYSQIEFGMTESERANDQLGAAGFLDLALANIRHESQDQLTDNEDPRRVDTETVLLFQSVGGSLSSLDAPIDLREKEAKFNRRVVRGKRAYSRVEVWFFLLVESAVCIGVFSHKLSDGIISEGDLIVIYSILSVIVSFVGWIMSSINKRWAHATEGILVSFVDNMKYDITKITHLHHFCGISSCLHSLLHFNKLFLRIQILACTVIWILCLIQVTLYFANTENEKKITANQLFMSYGSFFTSLYLITEWTNASVTTSDWIFLCAASATIVGVLYIEYNAKFDDPIFRDCPWKTEFQGCGRFQLVVLITVVSTFTSLIMALVSFYPGGRLMHLLHAGVGTLLLASWVVGAYFILFGEGGYGERIGPIFFSAWGSLFFCVDLITTNLVLLCRRDDEFDSASSAQSENESIAEEVEITFDCATGDVSNHPIGEEQALFVIDEGFGDIDDDYDRSQIF